MDLCAAHGYASVTMEAIATHAKVGKPTVYRWWPSKGALMLDALMERLGERFFVYPDTGDITADLRAWVHTLVGLFNDESHRRLLTGVIGSVQHDPELAAIVHGQIHVALEARNLVRLVAAQEAGELPPTDPSLISDLLVAPLWYHLLVTGQPLSTDYADAVLGQLLSSAPVRSTTH